MKSAAQRQWEAEQYDPAPEECLDCHRPILDRGDQYWPSACHCPRCDWCGAHGPDVETTILDGDEVCRACRDAEGR
jgi:hypothetical protein